MATTRRGTAAELHLVLEQVLEQVLWCWLCGEDRMFLAPLGEDAAAHARSERLCAECGSAVLVDVRLERWGGDQTGPGPVDPGLRDSA